MTSLFFADGKRREQVAGDIYRPRDPKLIPVGLMLFAIFPSVSLAQGIRPRGQNLEVANS